MKEQTNPIPPPMPTTKSTEPFMERPGVLLLLFLFCFPVGLFIVFQANWKTTRKIKWIGGFIAYIFIFSIPLFITLWSMHLDNVKEDSLKNSLREADQQWETGDRFDVVNTYKSLLKEEEPGIYGYEWLNETERARLYRRIIEHEVEYGDISIARDWIREAKSEGIEELKFESQKTTEIWNEYE